MEKNVTELLEPIISLKTGDIINDKICIFNELVDEKDIKKAKKSGFKVAILFEGNLPLFLMKIHKIRPSYVMVLASLIEKTYADDQLKSVFTSIIIMEKEMNYKVIAKNITSKEELKRVIQIGILYGQGKYLCNQVENKFVVRKKAVLEIIKLYNQNCIMTKKNFVIRNVGDICKKGICMSEEDKAKKAYEYFKAHEECTTICITGEDNLFKGLVTKTDIMSAFSGRYGYNLHQKCKISELSKKYPLIVFKDFSIESVSKLAMQRIPTELYDPVVVLEGNKYFGIVTIKDLLSSTVLLEVARASEANPLTSLPGNQTIDSKIREVMERESFFAIIYLDLDNFKAYNDAYGFSNGDRMIQTLAEIMKKVYGNEGFLGHIGGDDFVIITKNYEVEKYCKRIIELFHDSLKGLYSSSDWQRGYIDSRNRNGIAEKFAIASISIAVVTNKEKHYKTMEELNKQIAKVKKKAKKIEGSSIVVV